MLLDKFISVAAQAADVAGDVLRHYYQLPLDVSEKADKSPVTIADKKAEMAIRIVISTAFPDHGIYGEEQDRVNVDAEYQWVIDPIDGTRAFIAGYPTFTTLIALCKNGVPIVGVIDQPILQKRWTSFTQQSLIHHSSPLIIATTSLDYFTKPQLEAFLRIKDKAANVLYGGDAYAYAMLVEGRIGCVIDAGMKPYDFLALVPVIENAGGVITDWKGKPLTLKSKGDVLACANKMLHAEALNVLSAA